MLLAPHAPQIRSLELRTYDWVDVLKLFAIDLDHFRSSVPLKSRPPRPMSRPTNRTRSPRPRPLSSKAPSIWDTFAFLGEVRRLIYFAFPNLTATKLSTWTEGVPNVSDLLNFLEAAPTLRTVEASVEDDGKRMLASIPPGDIPQESVVILPDVESFSLFVVDATHVFDLAAHILCPPRKVHVASGRDTGRLHVKRGANIPRPCSLLERNRPSIYEKPG
jgi:hypothetical protein